jgi:glycosyltransferase involved in cell wall biosynthesis
MPDPDISIVMPLFNVEPYLNDCLQSLGRQTFGHTAATRGRAAELIIVNDGSSDTSPLIAAEFAAQMNQSNPALRVAILHKENEGASLARRDGLAQARGEWLAFVDSDDWVATDFLERLYLKAEQSRCDVVACGLTRTPDPFTRGNVVTPVFNQDSSSVLSGSEKFCINDYPLFWNKLWRRSLIERWLALGGEFPGKEVTFGEDIALTYIWIALGERLTWVPDCLYFYRKRSNSAVSQCWTDSRHRRSIRLAVKHMLQEASKMKLLEAYRAAFARVAVLHLIRANAYEIRNAILGQASAEEYCVSALSVLGQWFPDWVRLTAENEEERAIFTRLSLAVVPR